MNWICVGLFFLCAGLLGWVLWLDMQLTDMKGYIARIEKDEHEEI